MYRLPNGKFEKWQYVCVKKNYQNWTSSSKARRQR